MWYVTTWMDTITPLSQVTQAMTQTRAQGAYECSSVVFLWGSLQRANETLRRFFFAPVLFSAAQQMHVDVFTVSGYGTHFVNSMGNTALVAGHACHYVIVYCCCLVAGHVGRIYWWNFTMQRPRQGGWPGTAWAAKLFAVLIGTLFHVTS